jgi:hypothetical protein
MYLSYPKSDEEEQRLNTNRSRAMVGCGTLVLMVVSAGALAIAGIFVDEFSPAGGAAIGAGCSVFLGGLCYLSMVQN